MKRKNQITILPPQFPPDEWRKIVEYLKLSPQQANIAALILQEFEDKEIARKLEISEDTIRSHMSILFPRLNVRSRGGVVRRLYEARERLRNAPAAALAKHLMATSAKVVTSDVSAWFPAGRDGEACATDAAH